MGNMSTRIDMHLLIRNASTYGLVVWVVREALGCKVSK